MRAILFTACLAACATGPGGPNSPPPVDGCPATPGVGVSAYSVAQLNVWSVVPAATGSCVTVQQDSHFVYVSPTAPLKGRLFVFLPGTGAVPENYRAVVQEAALAGYHGIGLTYVNGSAVGVLCIARPADCHARVREEVLTGEPLSDRVVVDRGNSIESRLIRLLKFMQVADPARNWSQFLMNDSLIRWDRISVAGHSQGGGQSLFIARRYLVFRATAFSSGGDLVAGQPAPWVAPPFATPAGKIYGFISERDELVDFSGAVAAWTAIGLATFGPTASVDGAAPPFGGSHILSTTAAPRLSGLVLGPNHNATVVDLNTPRSSGGSLVFAPVWRYLALPD